MNRLKIDRASPVPKVRQIEHILRRKIEAKELSPGKKLPSMQDLAEHFGVSIGIIKLALRTLSFEGYLRSVPKSGVFVADTLPLKSIALVLSSAELEQVPRIIRATRGSLPKNYRLVIEASSTGYEGQIDILKTISSPYISGIILQTPPARCYIESIQRNLPSGIPCIQALAEFEELGMDSVTADGFSMGQIATNHLIQMGHRKIGLIGNESDNQTFIARKKGIDFAMKQIGQSYNSMIKETVDPMHLDFDAPWNPGRNAALHLLEKHPDITAIIGGDGHITLGAYKAIIETGRSVPEDISLIAMELDLPSFEHTNPPISAVDKPFELVFSRAVELLVNRIESPDRPLQSIHLAPVLCSRDSVKKL
ncbi:MAG: GntR family transcriptional regulator [Kiritimatiellales bacterium]